MFATKEEGKLETLCSNGCDEARNAEWPQLIKYLDHRLQLDGVGSELADSVGQLLHGHAVFVVLPAESLLVHVDLLQVTGLGCGNQTDQQSSSVRQSICCNMKPNIFHFGDDADPPLTSLSAHSSV